MPTLAERMNTVKASIIVQIANKAREMKKAGQDVISFSIGVPGFLPARHVYEAAHRAVDTDEGAYLPVRGSDELVEAFLGRLKADGFSYTPEEVCAAMGAKNALFNLFYSLLDKRDEVIIPAPYWTSYMDMLEMVEATPVILRCGADQNYKMTPQQLEAAITPKTKMLLFTSPSNPTGMVYTKEEIAALGEVLSRHDIWVISDDIYDKMVFDGVKAHHLLHTHPQLRDRVIMVQSVSKSYGMPGWRVGMMAGPKEVAKAMTTMNANVTMNLTAPAMAAAAAAFSGPQDFVEEARTSLEKKRDLVLATLAEIPDLVCPRPQGAFYAFPDVSAYFGTSYKGEVIKDDVQLCTLLLEKVLVAVVPGGAFGEPNALRISYAIDEERLKEGLSRLKAFFAACEGGTRLSA